MEQTTKPEAKAESDEEMLRHAEGVAQEYCIETKEVMIHVVMQSSSETAFIADYSEVGPSEITPGLTILKALH